MASPLHHVLGQQCEVVLTSQDALVEEVKTLLDNFEVQVDGNLSCSNTCEATERKIDLLEEYLKNKFDETTSRFESAESRLDSKLDDLSELIGRLQQQMNQLHPPGSHQSNPAKSCADILTGNPSSPSGTYWIEAPGQRSNKLFCDMTLSCGGVTGGWTRVYELDMRNSNNQCPSSLKYRTDSGKRTCGINSNSGICSSVIFPAKMSTGYSKVCGKITAYQVGSPDTFGNHARPANAGLNNNYVDGVSLTYGNPRQHIWTFAAGLDENASSYPQYNCPCTDTSRSMYATPPPTFVGNDYFCDTGSAGHHTNGRFYPDDPLWDGDGCGHLNACCTFNNPPWFYKQLPQPTTDNVEMRVCRDESSGNEDIAIEFIKIFVQ